MNALNPKISKPTNHLNQPDEVVVVWGCGVFGFAMGYQIARTLAKNGQDFKAKDTITKNYTQTHPILFASRSEANQSYYQSVLDQAHHPIYQGQLEKDALDFCRVLLQKDLVSYFKQNLHSQSTLAIVIATPSHCFASVLKSIQLVLDQVKGLDLSQVKLCWVSKGLIGDAPYFLPEVYRQKLPHYPNPTVLTGPGFAKFILAHQPSAITVGNRDLEEAMWWACRLKSGYFRPYVSQDMKGLSLVSALKNPYAIGAGMIEGLGFSANTQAFYLSRALEEMRKVNDFFGGQEPTAFGLSGLGDLSLTCSDSNSRNRQFGYHLSQCKNQSQALEKVGALVEGLHTLKVFYTLIQQNDLELPILQGLYRCVWQEADIFEVMQSLFERGIGLER